MLLKNSKWKFLPQALSVYGEPDGPCIKKEAVPSETAS